MRRVGHSMAFYGISDRGLRRQNNEDHFIVADLSRQVVGVCDNRVGPELIEHVIGERGTLLAVADGLGGYENGELASSVAVETLVLALFGLQQGQELSLEEQLTRAVHAAHDAIRSRRTESGHDTHMASTITAMHVGAGMLTICQVGDSRAYRFENGQLTLLTEDQTVVGRMCREGMLTAEEAKHHPHRHVILQALGQDQAIQPVVQTHPYQDEGLNRHGTGEFTVPVSLTI